MVATFKSTSYDREYYEEREVHDERWRPYNEAVASALVDELRPTRVLDVACGVGNLVKTFREIGADAWGIELSEAAIEMSHVKENLLRCDVATERFPFEDDSFDLVTSFEFVEHIDDAGVRNAYKEIARVLKPGGHYFQQTPVPGSAAAKLDPTHINVKSRSAWVRLAAEYGFTPQNDRFYAIEHRFPKGNFGQRAPRWVRELAPIKWYVVTRGSRSLFKLEGTKEASA